MILGDPARYAVFSLLCYGRRAVFSQFVPLQIVAHRVVEFTPETRTQLASWFPIKV